MNVYLFLTYSTQAPISECLDALELDHCENIQIHDYDEMINVCCKINMIYLNEYFKSIINEKYLIAIYIVSEHNILRRIYQK